VRLVGKSKEIVFTASPKRCVDKTLLVNTYEDIAAEEQSNRA